MFIWEGKKKKKKKKRTLPTHVHLGGKKKTHKRNFQHTHLFGRENNKKEIEKLSNWQV